MNNTHFKLTMIDIYKTLLLSTLLLLGSQTLAKENKLNTKKSQVQTTITTMVNAIDTKQWDQALSQFANEVFVDYSSLTNQPGSKVKAADLVGGWQNLLKDVDTHHMLSNFDITVTGKNAETYSHVYASHQAKNIDYWDAYGRYHHKLKKDGKKWKITSMTLIMHGQKGNKNFLSQVTEQNNKTANIKKNKELIMKTVEFNSEGSKVIGNLYYPTDYDSEKQYPAITVSGSWTTVKEQMAGLYAKKLSENGFITLAFDPRHFGQSEGLPRFYEKPSHKVQDIKNAVTYLKTLPEINDEKIGAFGVCAGAMYTLVAASEDKRIKSVATAASWLHDAEAVKMFYGGEEGVQEKIRQAQMAKKKYSETGETDYIPAISTEDESAAMYGPYDYYLNPERGAIKEWSNDKFAVMTWEDWLTFDPMDSAKKLSIPTLMIHSDGAVLPDYTKQYFDKVATKDKSLYWIHTDLQSPYHQFNFYDQPQEVNEVVEQTSKWFDEKLI